MPDDVERELKRLAGETAGMRERLAALRKKLIVARDIIESARRALGEGEGTHEAPQAQEEAKAG